MVHVMIKCPDSGEAIPTGYAMNGAIFEEATLTNQTVQCPICRQLHAWSKGDSWLQKESFHKR
jgi:hypothetical protein